MAGVVASRTACAVAGQSAGQEGAKSVCAGVPGKRALQVCREHRVYRVYGGRIQDA